MSPHRTKILQEIQGGRRIWTLDDVPDRDPELFVGLVLTPLCQLLNEGLVTAVNEHTENRHGEAWVIRVHVTVDQPFDTSASVSV